MEKLTFDTKSGMPLTVEDMNLAVSRGWVHPAFDGSPLSVDKMLDFVDVKLDWYIPSIHSMEFMNFIRLVLGEEPQNTNPKAHYFLIDCIFKQDNVKPYFDVRGIDYDMLKDRVLVLATREFSKALDINEKVKTPAGPVKIKDLKVGDEIFSRGKEVSTVTGKSEIFRRPTYHILLDSGSKFIACEDHEHFVLKYKTEKVVIDTKELYRNPSIYSIEKEDGSYDPIVEIRRIQTVATQCISVSSGSKSFILENGVVTHNSTLLGSMLVLFIAAKGTLPGFGRVKYMLYVSDSMRNNVKTTMETIGSVYLESPYLRTIFEEARLVQDEVNFIRKPRTKKEIQIYDEFVSKKNFKPHEVPGRSKRMFTMKGVGASALSLDTVLCGDNGSVTMGDVKVGDTIMGDDGKPTKIVEKSVVFNRPMYKIYLSNGSELKVCFEHINNIMFVDTHNSTIEELNLDTISLFDLKFKIESMKDRDLQRHLGLYVKSNPAVELSKNKLPINPYLLGFIYSTGTIKNGIVKIKVRSDLIDEFKELSGLKDIVVSGKEGVNYSVAKAEREGKPENILLKLDLLDVYSVLEDAGVIDDGKIIYVVPDVFKYSDIEDRTNLLAGIFDSAYRIKVKYDKINIIDDRQTIGKIYPAVKYLISSLGGLCSTGITKEGSSKFTISYYIKDVVPHGFKEYRTRYIKGLDLFNKIWYKSFGVRRGEEYGKFRLTITPEHRMHKIERIERISDEPSQCIGVDNKSHLFLAGPSENHYLVTHNTGARGSREGLDRPDGCFFDDLIGSESDASSDVILDNIESTIESDILPAMSGNGSFKIFAGTPYNKKDPAYRRIEEGSWLPVVFPKAESMTEFMTKKNFRGVWDDRHTFERCKSDYMKAKTAEDNGNPLPMRKLMQEFYLRISNDSDRLVPDTFIHWVSSDEIMANSWNYNWYITTDYTTTGNRGSDLSGVALWAVDHDGVFNLVELTLRRMELETQYAETFAMVKRMEGKCRGVEVGIELDGQQRIHLLALKDRMKKNNIYFKFASQKGKDIYSEGILSRSEGGSKHWRFRLMLPMFQNERIKFSERIKESDDMRELMEEIKYATYEKFGSTYDDGADLVSMIGMMNIRFPEKGVNYKGMYSDKKKEKSGSRNDWLWRRRNVAEEGDDKVNSRY